MPINSEKLSRSTLLERLDNPATNNLRGADLRGLDLSNMKFAFLSLESANLDGANISGSTFQHVDLSGASLRGANLDMTSLRFVRACGAEFEGLQADTCHWNWSSLIGSNFKSAKLTRTRFMNCGLESVSFEDADMTLGSMTGSIAHEANFSGANLEDVETFQTSFQKANLTTARNFAFCREIVLEILMREADVTLETMQWLGAATLLRDWCYPVWAELLKGRSELKQMLEVFRQYPESGCLQALRAANIST